MTRTADVVADVAIFGGGIAGLWLLDRLIAHGFSAVLFEADRLGAGQSVASQGIIHGGAKYTLGLARDSAVRELRGMPSIWGSALRGDASTGPDLSRARTLSQHTHLWVPRQLGGGVIGAFSRLVMRSHVRRLPRTEWPEGLRCESAKGSVYALDELVLDVPSVLEALRVAHRARIRRMPDARAVTFEDDGARLRVGDLDVDVQRTVLTAGAGNEALLARAGISRVRQQRRPLHQVVIGGMKSAVYAHCVGRSTRPLATVTAHPSREGGDHVWSVGGQIAEQGVEESAEQLIERAKRVLPTLFPGADFGSSRWATYRVDRAEGAVEGGHRPDGPILHTSGRILVAWPTKLALAPSLANRIVAALRCEGGVQPVVPRLDALAALPEPSVARPPWEEVDRWS